MQDIAEGRAIRRYEDLVELIRERRIAWGLSGQDMDALVGLATGYTGKVERSPSGRTYTRSLGRQSLHRYLEALGLVLVAVDAGDVERRRVVAQGSMLGKRRAPLRKLSTGPCWLCGGIQGGCSRPAACIERLKGDADPAHGGDSARA